MTCLENRGMLAMFMLPSKKSTETRDVNNTALLEKCDSEPLETLLMCNCQANRHARGDPAPLSEFSVLRTGATGATAAHLYPECLLPVPTTSTVDSSIKDKAYTKGREKKKKKKKKRTM